MIGDRRWARVALVAVVCAALTACTQVVDGTATKGPDSLPPGAVDPLRLAPGNYPTTPRQALGTAGSEAVGAQIEGARMTSYVVGPWEVDSRLTVGVQPTQIATEASRLSMLLPEAMAAAVGRHQFVTSFMSGRKAAEGDDSMVIAVLRFAGPQSARAAADELHRLALEPVDEFVTAGEPIPIPGQTEALASAYMNVPYGSDRPVDVVNSYTPHGPFVLYQYAKSEAGRDAAVGMIERAVRQQMSRIDEFDPTEVAELADLPVDPTGLLARTIPDEGDGLSGGYISNKTFDRAGTLHFQTDPIAAGELFEETDMDVWAKGRPGVYQARDAGAAEKLLTANVAESRTMDGASPADAVPNLTGSECTKIETPLLTMFTCFAAADRYLIEASSAQLPDVHQITAAQYLMLTS